MKKFAIFSLNFRLALFFDFRFRRSFSKIFVFRIKQKKIIFIPPLMYVLENYLIMLHYAFLILHFSRGKESSGDFQKIRLFLKLF